MIQLFKRINKNSWLDNEHVRFPSKIESHAINNKGIWKAVVYIAEKSKTVFSWKDVKIRKIMKSKLMVEPEG